MRGVGSSVSVVLALWMASIAACTQSVMESVTYPTIADFKAYAARDREARLMFGAELLNSIRDERAIELERQSRALREEWDAKALETESVRMTAAEAIESPIIGLIEKHTELADTVSRISAQLVQRKTTLDELGTATEASEQESTAIREASEDVANDVVALTQRVGEAEGKLDKLLHTELALRIHQASKETNAELVKLTDDSKALGEKLQAAVKSTDAKMEALKGLSTEEILAIVGAAGAAAAVGGVVSRMGKGRSHGQIAQLEKSIKRLERASL